MLLILLARFAAGQYAGSESSRGCHPDQFAGHANTGHARSLSHGGAAGEWAFGAGMQAVTFVSQLDEDHYIEHGLSWYAASKSMALTPGHRTPQGDFQCHSTGPLRLGPGFKIEPSEAGVQCETCHGPGAKHAVRNPKRLTAAEVNDLCGGCHRKPAAAGDDTDWTNPWNTRHEPLYLAESACFLKSKGALSCLTCHPAHAAMSRVAADYDRACSKCHASSKHRTAVAAGAFVTCHMPVVEPQPNLRFANHWIGVYGAGKPLRPIVRP